MHSKTSFSRSRGFAQCSPAHLLRNKFLSDSPAHQFSVPSEIFRNLFIHCHLLFNYQCSLLSCDSSFNLSHLTSFCQHLFLRFFIFFFKLFSRSQRNLSYHCRFKLSTSFFEIFSNNLYNFKYKKWIPF